MRKTLNNTSAFLSCKNDILPGNVLFKKSLPNLNIFNYSACYVAPIVPPALTLNMNASSLALKGTYCV